MADLSQLFGAQRGNRTASVFDRVSDKAGSLKRRMVMNEAMRQDLSPEDGDPFFKFVGERLFQLGDIQGAMAVAAKREEIMGAQAAAQQKGFENQLKLGEYELKRSKELREASAGQKTSRIATGAELGITDPALKDAAIEVKEQNGQIVGFEVLSKGGTNVDVNVDARPPKIGGSEASKPTINLLQESVVKSSEGIGRLAQINATYDERFLQLGTRMQEFGGRIKDFLGRATPEDQQLITEFQDFKSSALDNLNLTLNQLSGAAVSPQEFKRISNALPNPGTGLFDGDSPTQFMSKLRRAERDLKLARARANLILSGGGTLEDIQSGKLSLGSMAKLMQNRIDEWDKAGFSKQQIGIMLRDTFGEL